MAHPGERPTARITLAQVARAAGVSSAAASLALNDRPGVAAGPRERVHGPARRLGYRRRPRGAGLLGVLPTALGNPYHTDVIAGIEAEADSLGLGVVIATAGATARTWDGSCAGCSTW